MEFENVTNLYVDLNVTREFSNGIFEFTIYNKEGNPLATRNRVEMSFTKRFDVRFYFEEELENPDHIIFKLKARKRILSLISKDQGIPILPHLKRQALKRWCCHSAWKAGENVLKLEDTSSLRPRSCGAQSRAEESVGDLSAIAEHS